jgi:hypothetical protein
MYLIGFTIGLIAGAISYKLAKSGSDYFPAMLLTDVILILLALYADGSITFLSR